MDFFICFYHKQQISVLKMIEKIAIFFLMNDLNRERIMNLIKNARGELYRGVQMREKWLKYLMQHLHKEKPTSSNGVKPLTLKESSTSRRKSNAINY